MAWTHGFAGWMLALSVLVPAGISLAQDADHVATGDDVILVLDASGSMWGQIQGEHKIVIARQVIGEMLTDLPATRRLGLIAYGHTREGDCTDIEQIAAVGAERDTIREAVNTLNPKGKTPLTASVRQAAEALGYRDARATVILVSDGEETCNLDPCAVGQELEAAGVDFTAHVIGFDIADARLRGELQCLAENTGGMYLNASNADELATALGETVVRAPEPAGVTQADLRATELSGGVEISSGLTWRVAPAGGDEAAYEGEDQGRVLVELAPGRYDVFVERPSDGLKGEARNVAVNANATRTVTIALEFDLAATLAAPQEAGAGTDVLVTWTGPARTGDWIAIAPVDAPARQYAPRSYAYVREGNPLSASMPLEPGPYEVRYVLGRPTRVLATAPIVATPVEATVTGAQSVAAGTDFEIAWTGPGSSGDWITVVAPDARDTAYTRYAYARTGSPVTLQAPLEAGAYELRYVQDGRKVIGRSPITVTAVEATLEAPDTVSSGAAFSVTWTGPDQSGDWLTVVEADARPTAYNDYAYTREGSPLTIRAPLDPGEYALRYVQDGKVVLASIPITVSGVTASITGPQTAVAGSYHDISWTGPGDNGDWMTVVAPDARATSYSAYKYMREGSPLSLRMPLEPGDYELRYVQDGKKVIAAQPITITEAQVRLMAPQTVVAGSRVDVAWENAPEARGDWVTIVKPDARDTGYMSYKYARNASPQQLDVPVEPGEYEFRYVLDGKRVVARSPVTVEDVTASLEAPETTVAGERFQVGWGGPGHFRDMIIVANLDHPDAGYVTYKHTRTGNPVLIDAPDAAGSYEVRYVLAGKRVIARAPLTVVDE